MTETTGLWIDEHGYLRHDRGRLIPVGVNYWPGSCGVEMWARWPADEMRRDLDLVRTHGLNSVRFSLRWQDFEPERGRYERSAFQRLSQFLTWCAERELWAQSSVFVAWMSGGVFWPPWKGEGNLVADPMMVAWRSSWTTRRCWRTMRRDCRS